MAIDASLIPTVKAAMAYRAGVVGPQLTLTLNDVGWFMVLFANNGLFAFYIPFSVLFIWIIALTWGTLKAITRQQLEEGSSFTPVLAPA